MPSPAQMAELLIPGTHFLVANCSGKPGAYLFYNFVVAPALSGSCAARPALFVCEVQLEAEVRSHGLGRHLMSIAEHIAKDQGMDCVMLKCQNVNSAAHAFYNRIGYRVDETSPQGIDLTSSTSQILVYDVARKSYTHIVRQIPESSTHTRV